MISLLTSSNQTDVARINNATIYKSFPYDKEVIVPVYCSCSGQYYKANTSFVILNKNQTYFVVANDTYQGLSTCDSLRDSNPYGEFDLHPGFELKVPLRCACPTKDQTLKQTKYLLTYSVSWRDSITDIAERFNVSTESILDANGFTEEKPTLFPFTTILIPLPDEPFSSQTKVQSHRPIFPSPIPSTSPKKSSNKELHLIIGISAGLSCLLVFTIIFCIILFLKKRKLWGWKKEREGKTKSILPDDLLVEISHVEQGLTVFGWREIKKATENFSCKTRIKGSAYRGSFNGKILAVKKTSHDISKEVNILKKINHFNLIKLHGICENKGLFYLVYEYMEKGSLKEWLHEKVTTKALAQRIQIALDVANGIYYLHNFTKPAYVHKDIKSSNILLNSNLRAKISNFHVARSADTGKSTSRLIGTVGYMAPEYVETGIVSPMFDVYAFGVVMMELITGKEATIIQQKGREGLLSAAKGENAEELECFVDPIFKGSNNEMDKALKILKLSIACLRRDPESRPGMGEVVSSLMKIQVDLHRSELLYSSSD